jgi:pimeloyl-ACP methyl ester carboxylesterase
MTPDSVTDTIPLSVSARPTREQMRSTPSGADPLPDVALGSGEPLFWINDGSDRSRERAAPVADILAPYFRVYVLNPESHGAPSASSPSIDIDPIDEARRCERLRRHLGLPRIRLAGWGFGGMVALTYAALYPRHARRCLVIHPSDRPSGERTRVAVDVQCLFEQIRCPVLVLTNERDHPPGSACAQRLVAGVRRAKILALQEVDAGLGEVDSAALRAAIIAWRWVACGGK